MRPSRGERPRKHELWFPCGRYFLRTIRREDASEQWAGWLADPWAMDVLNLAPKKLQKADIAQYIKTFDQRSRLLLGVFENGTRLHVGFVRLDIDFATNSALVNAVIGEPEHRNRGATTNVFVPILDFLFDTVGLEKVRASVLERNQVTLQYLLKMGWQIDEGAGGRIKSSTDGALLDLRMVVWTREAYRAFRLTGIGSRILRRLSGERAKPR